MLNFSILKVYSTKTIDSEMLFKKNNPYTYFCFIYTTFTGVTIL